ncbi:hypothetical protein [Halalkalibacter alkaliphilus]|uniref:Uncharacterized protein n=1 Tax=Halalkalibacter alkaliphilus TaxID=2917993 RepID=A0A9X2CWB5_9BACI|nr:hypothetical protein [Halalkalibacter alkaliphilus]MCL7749433.1 hypothetical protein [Halalkalibacter alkaliphilus]
MEIHNLIESKQYFVDETKVNYYVVYEKFENIEALIKENRVEERNQGTEEIIYIFHGYGKGDLLQTICSYRLDIDHESISDTLNTIKEEHKEIFK